MGTTKKRLPVKKSRAAKPEKELSPSSVLTFQTGDFLSDLDCILEMFDTVIPVLDERDKARKTKIDEISDSMRNRSKKKRQPKKLDLGKIYSEMTELLENVRKLDRANELFRQHALVMMVSRYDQFIADVLRTVFRATPDRLKSPDKTLSYQEILQLGSLDQVIDKFISKEVDALLHEARAEPIKYLDKQLGIGLRDRIDSWPTFIELTERRNLFVHTGGKVSRQYLQNCKANEVALDGDLKEDARLALDAAYLKQAHKCLLELGVKTSQLVHRKLWPKESEAIDASLNQIGYDFLIDEKWDLAKVVFEFAVSLPRKLISGDAMHKMFLINLCIALKWSGEKAKCLELLDETDWSAADAKFQLAVRVLKGEFKKAETIMSGMNGRDPIAEHDFRTWPVFKEFRETDNFKRAYRRIYHKDCTLQLSEVEGALANPGKPLAPEQMPA